MAHDIQPSALSPQPFSAIDHAHMARALRLAERGLYTTQPNPRVGCVIAHGETVVGEGWHERAGEPHAEVFALRAAGAHARGATAYVTLEPCAHFGRTPPCADALIAAGVARVVAAAEDPNPHVDGRGFEKLRAAGIAAEAGLMRAAAREVNCGFFSRLERGRPWVRVKLAASLDGRTALAGGASRWITGEAARADVQYWRARSSAILTGSGTGVADDPRLTVRAPWQVLEANSLSADGTIVGGEGRGEGEAQRTSATFRETRRSPLTQASPQSALGGEGVVPPLRVVLDARLRTPHGAQVLDGSAPTLIVHMDGRIPADDRFAAAELVAVAADESGRLDLDALLRLLAGRGVNELQVEAGATLSGALLAADLVDELLLYVAPLLLGDGARPLFALPAPESVAAGRRLRLVDARQVGSDQRMLYRRATD
jgi:diaminohydroxyphosphoribosylaminopyrimidine deaminase/5-amino-6-(5-phosphoribosylamino)uracil reductase